MIIACPACETRYVVPDSAIGVDGRTVRCAKCKHSWFQDGASAEQMAAAATAQVPQADVATRPTPTPAPRPAAQPAPASVASKPAERKTAPPAANPDASPVPKAPPQPDAAPGFSFDSTGAEKDAAPPRREGPDFDQTHPPSYGEDDIPPPLPSHDVPAEETVSRFDRSPPFRPRRNTLKMWTWAAAIFAVLALVAIIAMQRTSTPDWWPGEQPLFGAAQPDLELDFPADAQKWRELENKTWLFSARINVTNTSRESRKLQPILIIMRDGRERQIYSWVVQPPQPTLAPGESITIDEARTDVPRNAVFADIGWAPL